MLEHAGTLAPTLKFTEEDVQRLASFLESDIKFENLDDETTDVTSSEGKGHM